MAKRSVADRILSSVLDVKDEGVSFIVVYDFETGSGGRIPQRFYVNLARLASELQIRYVQKSVVLCRGRRAALAVRRLVEHYGGYARVFRVLEET